MSELSELFDRDPLKLTKEDRKKIIAKFREDRNLFLAGKKAPAKAKTKKSAIDLNSLDI